jgi:gamma-glutamyltranspeptidase/glutathione hydrolase
MMRGFFARVLLPLCVAVALAPSPRADTAPPIIEGQARVLPVLAKSGMVVAQEGIAARIGVDILKRGGNAVDAAVAVGFALAVTLPRAGNLGGGGFMLIRLAKNEKTIALDYRETAPAATTPEVFLNPQGLADPYKSRDSGLAVGVPGTVAGLAYAHGHYGSGSLTLADLLAPAIALARDGILVEDDLADSLPRSNRLRRYASSRRQGLRARRPARAARPRGNTRGDRPRRSACLL